MTVICISVISSQKFGERIKGDKTNSSLIDMIFRPQTQRHKRIEDLPQLIIGDSKKRVIKDILSDTPINSLSEVKVHNHSKQNASNQQIESSFDTNRDNHNFDIVLADIPEIAALPSEQQNNYEKSVNEPSFYESAPKHSSNGKFSLDIPQGFPNIKNVIQFIK